MVYPPVERQEQPGTLVGRRYGNHQAIIEPWSRVATRSTYGDDWEYYSYKDYNLVCACGEDIGFIGATRRDSANENYRLYFLEHVIASWYDD